MSYTESDVRALMNELEYNESNMAALKSRNEDIRKSLTLVALGETWVDCRGVQHAEVAGVKLKFETKQNYTLKKDVLAQIYPGLSEQDKKAISYKPEVSLTGLKAASADGLAKLNTCITTKPGLPVVSYGK